ncbi:hypothetical protein [Sanguibacter massiliensis]|uniref:hypothetical protein n=1 Tax=Sanguibacter massiliensis TaxID=1973217 RepID=UPI00101ADF5D|nr:hypothetical protein [Sanguibacter massiliensis]
MSDDEAFARLRATDPAAGVEPDVVALRARVTALVGDVAGSEYGTDLGLRLRVARLLVEDGAQEEDAAAAAAILGAAGTAEPAAGVAPPAAAAGASAVPARRARRRGPARWLAAAAAVLVVGGMTYVAADRLGVGTGGDAPSAAMASMAAVPDDARVRAFAVEDAGVELGSREVVPADAMWSESMTLRAVALEPVPGTRATVAALARVVGVAGDPVRSGTAWTVADGNGTLTVDGTYVDYARTGASSGVVSSPDAPGVTARLVAVVGAAGLDVDGMAFAVDSDGTAAWTTPRAADADVVGDGVPAVDSWSMKVDDDGIVALAGTLLRRTTTDLEVRAVTDVLGAGAPADGVTLRVVLQPDGDGWVPVASYVARGPDGTEARPAS